MPVPDPQPPQPRAISPARWLLLLLPSVPILVMPWIKNPWGRIPTGDFSNDQFQIFDDIVYIAIAVGAVMSLIMGFALEKWRHGALANLFRVIGYGWLIFAVNFSISICGVFLIIVARAYQ